MRHVKIQLAVLFFVALLTPAFAGIAGIEYMHYGDYTFLVEVNNQYGQQAFGVTRNLTVKDNIARIDVTGRGYLPDSWEKKLEEDQKVYHVSFRLQDPAITKALSDKAGAPVKDCIFSNEKPENLYFGFEYGFTVDFPKAGYEKISACNFKVYINGKEIETSATIAYLSSRQDKWHLEVVVSRDLLDIACNNHFEIVVFQCLHSQPDVACLVSLADDYNRNLELAGSVCDETSLLMIQDRLESNAQVLNIYFPLMDAGEQREILSNLPVEGDMVRSLKSMAAFAELHR